MFKETFYLVLLILLTLMIGKTRIYNNPFRLEIDDVGMLGIWAIIIIFYIITYKYETYNIKQTLTD